MVVFLKTRQRPAICFTFKMELINLNYLGGHNWNAQIHQDRNGAAYALINCNNLQTVYMLDTEFGMSMFKGSTVYVKNKRYGTT